MSNKTIITRQLYHLQGDKKTKGTYMVSTLDTLDENQDECACRAIGRKGEKSFVIVQKNDDLDISQEEADAIFEGKVATNVSYIEIDGGLARFVRYLTGDEADAESGQSFFEAVQKRISKETAFRGWSINNEGVLTVKKPEYFY